MTSGGDAPGMNAAVRAVVRVGLHYGLRVYGIHNGWQGAVDGGEAIEEMTWERVGGIIRQGGTILGTARCQAFRSREGRLRAAVNLYRLGVDGLVVIGGDGSLTGARILSEEWADLLRQAAENGEIELAAEAVPTLAVVGLPGSIDNDTYGSDMSIGADTALHRIVTAADQLVSTASAHQRTFVLEVMGRHCGYLALAGSLAAGGHWVLIPEEELHPRWHQEMVASLQRGRAAGRAHGIIMLAEGARHPDGLPLEANAVKQILTQRLGVDTRVTVLGHVQRGGAPSAFDRVLATRLGAAAVMNLMEVGAEEPPRMLGIVNNRVKATSLEEMVRKSREVVERLDEGEHQTALELRGLSFKEQLKLQELLTRTEANPEQQRGNLLVMTAGYDAPGMNACLRVATRVALEQGYRVLAAQFGFEGLLRNEVAALGWMDVSGWASRGGSELGAGRFFLQEEHLGRVAQVLREHEVSALLAIGSMSAYQNVAFLQKHRQEYAELEIPMVVIPASINNNLPATEFSIGADTALNNIVNAVDKLKDTAGSHRRAFIVEVMGYHCGYLALMAALASGAEQVYLPEEGITLQQLVEDVHRLRRGFEQGRRLALIILNERASAVYDQNTIRRIMDEEGGELFDVRSVILAHIQRGGSPSPFDRILAARFAVAAVEHLLEQQGGRPCCCCVGLQGKQVVAVDVEEALAQIDWPHERPKEAWYMELKGLARML
ncbi:MAG: 6-phosphofructokinase [Caldilineae bacterium]|nr:MAG: 6-phosphofructokinase [Caldilineae bacterium]